MKRAQIYLKTFLTTAFVLLLVGVGLAADSFKAEANEEKNDASTRVVWERLSFCGTTAPGNVRVYYALTDDDWKTIEATQKPTRLIFSFAQVSSAELSRLRGNPFVRSIHLIGCPNIADDVVEVLSEIPNLQEITIQRNERLVDPDLKLLAKCERLEGLDLWACPRISEKALDGVLSLSKLDSFKTSAASVSDRFLAQVAEKTPGLVSLGIDRADAVSDRGLDALKSLKNLRGLSIKDCPGISKEGFAQVAESLRLTRIEAENEPGVFFALKLKTKNGAWIEKLDAKQVLKNADVDK